MEASWINCRCLLCMASCDRPWCNECEKDLRIESIQCPICARAVNQNKPCGHCQNQTPLINRTEILFYYRYPVNRLIHSFKFNQCVGLAKAFADLMKDQIKKRDDELPAVLIPVPLHNSRQRHRGYNQSLEFAKAIGKQLTIPIDTNACRRKLKTEQQSSLKFKERKQNVKGAFELKKEHLPEHIAIIDDVITSGSTINELARLLRSAGVQQIEAWLIAKTI